MTAILDRLDQVSVFGPSSLALFLILGLYVLGYRPNPGLKSTPLYVLEAAFILLTFWKGLLLSPHAAIWGFACGAGLFILVLPLLRAWRAIAPSWRRAPWVRWQPLPAWTKD